MSNVWERSKMKHNISVFEQLLIQKISLFINDFKQASRGLFFDDKNNKLIHPGEFGVYREKICKEFLRHFTPLKYSFGTGFIINDHNEVSSQCDIIIYDQQSTPLIQDNALQTFYPIESIVSIGEIKSILTKAEFAKALKKLSKVKEMREKIKTPVILSPNSTGRQYNPKNYHYDQVFTFVICEKLDFNCGDLVNELSNIYKDVDVTNRHNLILSIDDGLICYYDGNNQSMMYPMHREKILKNRIITAEDKNIYFKIFTSYFFLATSSTTLLYPELSNYMGTIQRGLNRDEE